MFQDLNPKSVCVILTIISPNLSLFLSSDVISHNCEFKPCNSEIKITHIVKAHIS